MDKPMWNGQRGMERVRYNQRSLSGFTLIELIAVIAVVAILLGLIIGVLSKARERADLVGSTTTLRNIGSAISLYTTDNQGFLPGPLNRGQWAVYGIGSNSLLYHVGEYMDLGPRPDERRFVDSFACPGWKRKVSSDALLTEPPTVVWWLNMEAALENSDARREPWGSPTHAEDGPNAHRRNPVKHIQITEPSRQMAMQSVDAEIGPWAHIPKKPVFGDVRTRLYFDWSVGTVPVEAGRNVFWPVR
jgi:prepilin-type N-terminal cleavage/methylation domain-containing protein